MDGHQKVRVCHIASGDLWAGAEVQVYNLVSSLHADPSLDISAVLMNPGRLADELTSRGVKVKIISERDRNFTAILSEADRWFAQNPVDILHGHRFKENILSSLLKRKGRARFFVQTVHGLTEPEQGFRWIKSAITTAVAHWFTRHYADRIIGVSEDIGRVLRTDIKPDRVVVIHNSVDIPTRDFADDREKIRQEFGLTSEHHLLGTAGRFKPVKGYDVFLEAARLISDRFPSARFVIAGDGPLRQKLEGLARQLKLQDKVIFAGFRNDIQAVLSGLDLFVMSSHHEGIPVVLLEAMALSKPVVVTAVGGMVEVVEPDKSGLLVKAGDPRELAAGCMRLLENPDLRARFGVEGSTRVKTEFTRELQCQRVIELYRTLMSKPTFVHPATAS